MSLGPVRTAMVCLAALVMTLHVSARGGQSHRITLSLLDSYAFGVFNDSGSEIAAYDALSHRLFITNVHTRSIDIVDISDPTAPSLVTSVSVLPFGAHPNSVAVHEGLVAGLSRPRSKTDPGKVAFFDAGGNALSSVVVGALPDMLTFTPNGKFVLVANEGEPNTAYTIDPESSVSIIKMQRGAAALTQAGMLTAGFTAFNGAALDASIRIFGPGATVAQDLEPEYITMWDSHIAFVTLQENNAIAKIDIRPATVAGLMVKGQRANVKGKVKRRRSTSQWQVSDFRSQVSSSGSQAPCDLDEAPAAYNLRLGTCTFDMTFAS